MQRFNEIIRDRFGNPSSGATVTVYQTGTTTLAAIYPASNTSDNPPTQTANPFTTGSDGWAEFAANDGDYDIKIVYPDSTTKTLIRKNFFDGTTATTVPVSSISLAMPSQYAVTGSPGTAISVAWNTQTANTVLAGPTTGAAAAPTFRALVAADLNSLAVDLTTNQTAAGNKIWSGTASFGSTVTVTGAVTLSNTLSLAGNMTWGASTNDIRDKTTKICVGAAGTYGWDTIYADELEKGILAGTAPTATTILTTLRAWGFAAAAINELCFSMAMPFDYEDGTDLHPFVQWSTNGTNVGNVVWKLYYSIIKSYDQGEFPAEASQSITVAAHGTVNRLMLSDFAAISGTGIEPEALMLIRLERDATNVADTCTDVAYLFKLGVHYQSSRHSRKNHAPPFDT